MCELDLSLVDPIVGIEDILGLGMVIINVQGTSDCDAVKVRLYNPTTGANTPEKVVDVTNGQWFVQFTEAAGDFGLGAFVCGADHKVEVRLECRDDDQCNETFIPGPIPCRPKEGDCPAATLTITPSTTCTDGVREVAVQAAIQNGPDAFYTWFFGVDQDLQPGEDSLAGGWLPAPDSDGVRTVETSFFYDATGDEAQTLIIRLETSSGPGLPCIYQETFTLEPCACDVDVTLEVRDANGIVDLSGCLPPGDYEVRMVAPANAANVNRSWSLNGADADASGQSFPVTLTADATATVSVAVSVGTCMGSAALDLAGCADCSDYQVALLVRDRDGTERDPEACLPPGTYTVSIAEPSGGDIAASWSIDGVAQPETGTSIDISLAEGDNLSVSANVSQGGCEASTGLTLRACPDCSDFNAELTVRDADGNDVTGDSCLEVGTYTVELSSPDPTTSDVQWQVNNEDREVTGTTLDVTLQAEDSVLVAVRASQGECDDQAAVNLQNCPETDTQFFPCVMLKIFALIGFGIFFIGIFLALCPAMAAPLIPAGQALLAAAALIVAGAALFALFFGLWIALCRPDRCARSAFIWQAVVLLGLIMVYAGFCPGCSWMLVGVLVLVVGYFLFLRWREECRPTACTVVTEWINLFTFVVNIIAVLEAVFAACVIASNPLLAVLWGLFIAGVQAYLWWRANVLGCINR